ncbi:MAG: Hsp20/alpha crystallin family protein [Candidatus Hodarchaeota archaeon]
MAKKKNIWSIDDDDEDDEGFPFDLGGEDFMEGFNKIFKELMKQFQNNKDFRNFSKNLFKQLGLGSPEDMMKLDPKKLNEIKKKGPFVYGFSVKFDPKTGKPIFDNFGNIKAPTVPVEETEDEEVPAPTSASVREPLADVLEEENEIVVVVELPGVKKEDITLDANEDSIEIRAEGGRDRRYQKNVWLPSKINPDKAKARYTNGILEVRLEKIEEKRKKGSSIPIE